MRYCVIKDTILVIDGSNNDDYIMLGNAQNAGFSKNEVEILSEEEYMARLENEPKALQEPTSEEYLLDLDYRLSCIELGL